MSVSRNRKKAWTALATAAAASLALASGCSDKSTDGTTPTGSGGTTPTTTGGTPAAQSGSANTTAGSAVTAGSSGMVSGGATGGGVTSTGGTAPQAGATSGGVGTGGSAVAGNGTGGSTGGSTAAGAGSGGFAGFEAGDTPPPRKLNVIAAPGEHTHGDAGLDTRAKTMLGKLVVDIGVNSGGYSPYLAKRGYHSMGAPCGACNAPGDPKTVGTCRVGEFMNTEMSVKTKLAALQQSNPEEDWGYFLNADGSVRWSDVAITGVSHGATTAAVAGRVVHRMWRVVSRSGPRDNTCGAAGGVCTLPLSTPSYDTACPPTKVAAWLDATPMTPIERFYGIVGTTDVECGDIMFDMHYAKYVGVPTLFNMPDSVFTGTNQFFTTVGGHLDFLQAANKPTNTDKVLDIAFGIPPENQNPTF
jgi:hypothetical protein